MLNNKLLVTTKATVFIGYRDVDDKIEEITKIIKNNTSKEVLIMEHNDYHTISYIRYYVNNFDYEKYYIIFKTINPFLLQSLDNVNVYIDGKHKGIMSFIGWGINEIMEDIFNESPYTKERNSLEEQFDEAMNNSNYMDAENAYEELCKILHPTSVCRKLMEIQLTSVLIESGYDNNRTNNNNN